MFAKLSFLVAVADAAPGAMWKESEFKAFAEDYCKTQIMGLKTTLGAITTTATSGLNAKCKAKAVAPSAKLIEQKTTEECTDETLQQYMCSYSGATGEAPGWGSLICDWDKAAGKKCTAKGGVKAAQEGHAKKLLDDVCKTSVDNEGGCTAQANLMNVGTAPAVAAQVSATSKNLLTGYTNIAATDKDKVKVKVVGTCSPGVTSWFPAKGAIGAPSTVDSTVNYRTDKENLCKSGTGKTSLPYGACHYDANGQTGKKCISNLATFADTACTRATYTGVDPCTTPKPAAAATTTKAATTKKSSFGVRSLSFLLAAGVSMVAAIMA